MLIQIHFDGFVQFVQSKRVEKLLWNPFVGFIKITDSFVSTHKFASKDKEQHVLFCSPKLFYLIIFSLDCMVFTMDWMI